MSKLRKLALLSAAGWVYSKGPKDPYEWPAFLGEQYAQLREQGREALAAGKQAAARRQQEIDEEMARAMGRRPNPLV
ncbi:MAG: hypothetical protein U0Y82_16655 [Thermoleophilia bacterium]